VNYDGGKNGAGVWQRIINLMPPHENFAELFGGSCAIARRKRPAPGRNIIVEVDPRTVAAVKPELPAVFEVYCGDALRWLRHQQKFCNLADWLLYVDPPYMRSTRSCQTDLYRHEFGNWSEHQLLIDLLTRSGARVLLSGYRSREYDTALAEWQRHDFIAGSRGGPRTESLWFNFPPPVALHDYRFLGQNRTDRQRIRRKVSRWTAKLQNMATLERRCLLWALDEARVSEWTLPPAKASVQPETASAAATEAMPASQTWTATADRTQMGIATAAAVLKNLL
jgi:DNA adenine methylase